MNNGQQPAFPTKVKNSDQTTDTIGGLTKREYIATMAMQGLIASGSGGNGADLTALWATQYADALLKQLDKVK